MLYSGSRRIENGRPHVARISKGSALPTRSTACRPASDGPGNGFAHSRANRARPVIRGRSPQPLENSMFWEFRSVYREADLTESSFQRRDAVTLLKILVLRTGRQVHRSKLIEWLWPETDERTGLNRLHGVVHALRNAIEPSVQHRNCHYLINEGDTYIFRPNERFDRFDQLQRISRIGDA